MNTFILNYTAKSCIINGLNFPLNSLICDVKGNYVGFNYAFAPVIGLDGQVNNVVISPILYSSYLNGQSANAPFASAAAIVTFYQNFISAGGGGIALAINMPVSGGIDGNRLAIAAGVLSQVSSVNSGSFDIRSLQFFSDDTDASSGGLASGDAYLTTTAGSTFLKVLP